MEKSIAFTLLELLQEKKIADYAFTKLLYSLVRTQEVSQEQFNEILYSFGRMRYTEGQNNPEVL